MGWCTRCSLCFKHTPRLILVSKRKRDQWLKKRVKEFPFSAENEAVTFHHNTGSFNWSQSAVVSDFHRDIWRLICLTLCALLHLPWKDHTGLKCFRPTILPESCIAGVFENKKTKKIFTTQCDSAALSMVSQFISQFKELRFKVTTSVLMYLIV